MSSPTQGPVNVQDTPFDPVRCAQLYNQLLHLAYNISSDSPGVSRDLTLRIKEKAASGWPNQIVISEDSAAWHFFSLIESYRSDADPSHFPFSADMLQPEPFWFDQESHTIDIEDGWNYILLFPWTMPPETRGGLFFDLDTNLVFWRNDFTQRMPEPDTWVPLQLMLSNILLEYEQGEHLRGFSDGRSWETPVRRTGAASLNSAVAAWDALLSAIESRLPQKTTSLFNSDSTPPYASEDPLPKSLLDQYELSSFAKAFLFTAKRPSSFACIAPGITTFTPESFAAIYDAEDPNPERLSRRSRDDGDEPSTLLFSAADGTIPPHVPESVNRHFEKSFGNARRTVARHAGLYIHENLGSSNMVSDGVVLITYEGVDDVFRFAGPSPISCAPWRPIRLAEMLWIWHDLVEEGVWEVGPGGVVTSHAWFTDKATEQRRRLSWS